MTGPAPYDATLYKGSAAYYLRGRPPYSRELRKTLAVECGLDGTGRLLDVGCGPGVLAVELAPLVDEAIGLDPDADMLTEAAKYAERQRMTNVRWLQGLAEQLPDMDLGRFRLVTFGQSFHRTDRERVAEAVYDLLEPGGSIALLAHTVDDRRSPRDRATQRSPTRPSGPSSTNTSVPGCAPGKGSSPYPPTAGRMPLAGHASVEGVNSSPRAERTSSRTSTASSPTTCRCRSRHPTSSMTGSTSSRPRSARCCPNNPHRGSSGTGRAIPTS